MYLILSWSYLNHSLRFVGVKKRIKKKSHIKSQSQYFGKKSQLDYFPKSFSPTGDSMYDVQLDVLIVLECICLSKHCLITHIFFEFKRHSNVTSDVINVVAGLVQNRIRDLVMRDGDSRLNNCIVSVRLLKHVPPVEEESTNFVGLPYLEIV